MDKKLTTIYLVRHGESEGNAGFSHEKSDLGSKLTDNGLKQTYRRKISLSHIHFDAVFSSDLIRAKRTAEIISEERELVVQTVRAIRERESSRYLENYPDKTNDQLLKEMGDKLKDLDDKGKMQFKLTPDMESPEESAIRLITFLREIAVVYPGKTILVVNHGNVMRSFLTHIGWAKFDELPTGAIQNTGYIVLQSDGVDFFVKETQGIEKKIGKQRNW